MAEELTEVTNEQPDNDRFLIAGIGASAGGTEALRQFFSHVPPNSGVAYVVILHLSPDYDSQLTEILQRETSMPVTQVTERVQVVPNHVYVIPPNQHLTMSYGYIEVSPNISTNERRAPVDIFFRSLADIYQWRAVGVILSGTGANGSMGIKRIKERGGAAFVQNPREALYGEMPRNAITTDLIDSILPVAEIPRKILNYKESLGTVHIEVENQNRTEDEQQALREIFLQLRARTGHDFTNYKRATLLRRIGRRINVHSLNSLAAYSQYLQQHPTETQALLKDLLISVTNFFRDEKAFGIMEREVLPQILQNKRSNQSVRIWVIGCATGEEAYSMAMLCAEKTLGVIDAPKVQIFATDIDEEAIATAREGLYTLNDAADVSPERLRRFFNKEGESYRIRREIREMVLFANHNVLKDPPFSHIDIITCRNVMIYLNNIAQERVLETIHFALEPGGYLFLGASESVNGASDLFLTVNREYHIFQSRAVAPRSFPVPESTPYLTHHTKSGPEPPLDTNHRSGARISYADLHQQLLEQYAPPSVVVNEEYDIVHLTERVGKYLQIGGGEVSKNLLKLIRPELRLELRTAFYQATQRRTNVEVKGLKIRSNGNTEVLNIHVRPVLREDDPTRGFMLVLFEPGTGAGEKEETVYIADEPMARQLEEELIRMKSQLRMTVEQHEVQAEELKASNEELQAMNEELRSAAEELETSKEELQSINEELTTVNQELKVKIEETTLSNNNFRNLINSTDIATIFLDRGLRINLFTPPARAIFNLIPTDFGRPISDITNKLAYNGLLEDAEQVLEKLQLIEKEVHTHDGSSYLLRALPYRTDEDRIDGVVISFIDVTERKKAEDAIHKSEERFRAFVTASSDVIYQMNRNWTEMIYLIGADLLPDTQEPNKNWIEKYIPETERARIQAAIEEAINNKRTFELEHQVLKVDGTTGWLFSRAVPLLDEHGEITEWFGVGNDITSRIETERKIKEAEERYRNELEQKVMERTAELKANKDLLKATMDASVDMIQVFEAVRNENGEIVDFEWILNNHTSEKYFGDTIGKRLLENNPGVVETGIFNIFKQVTETGVPQQYEKLYVHEQFNGWFYQSVVKLGDGVATTTLDITERKQAEQQLKDNKTFIEEITQTTPDLITIYDASTNQIIYANNNNFWKDFSLDNTPTLYRMEDDERAAAMIHPDELEKAKAYVRERRLLKENEVKEVEFKMKDGKWIRIRSKVFKRNSQGEALQIISFTSDITEQKKADAEILRLKDEIAQKATDKYRTLFNVIDEGFAIIELVYNKDGKLVDFAYQETNPACVKQLGVNLKGKRRTELFTEKMDYLLEKYGQIAQTGEPLHFEYQMHSLGGQWFQVAASRIGGKDSKILGVVFRNITERKWKEQRQEFLLKLTDALKPIADPVAIEQKVTEMTMDYFGADRCYYATIEGDIAIIGSDALKGNATSVAGVYRLSDFEIFKKIVAGGVPLVVYDVATSDKLDDSLRAICLRLDVISFIDVPVIKNGKPVGIFSVVQSSPRNWTGAEIELAVETAERTSATVEKVRTEKALLDAHIQNKEILESIGDIFYAVDKDFVFTYVNYRAEQAWHKKRDDIIGKNMWEVLPQAVDSESYQQHTKAMQAHQPVHYDTISPISHRWISVSIFPSANGGLSVFFRDIHDRIQAEAALRESEERNSALVNQTSVGIMRVDVNGTIVFMNEKAQLMLGINGSNGAERTIWEFTPPEDLDEHKRLYNRLIEHGLPFQFEKKLKRDNGSFFWASASMAPIKDSNRKNGSAVSVIVDVTGRKQAKEALRETMERFQYAVHATKDVIWEIDLQKDRVWWSSMMHTLFGYSQSEVKHSLSWYQSLIHPADHKRVVKGFLKAIESNDELWIDEFNYRQANGSYVCVTNRSFIIRDEHGKAVRMIGAMQDITERKKAEAALRESEERLRITLEAGELATWDWNVEKDKIIWNEQHYKLLGITTARYEYVDVAYFLKFVHADDLPEVKQQLQEVLGEKGIYQAEFRITREDNNEVRWMHGYGRATERQHGKVLRASGVMYDITERRAVEQALETAQNSLTTALEAAQMGVWDIDLATDVTLRSARHDQLLGFEEYQEEWSHERVKEHMVEEDKPKFDAARKNMFETGIFELEARIRHEEKGICWVQLYGKLFRNERGEPTHAAGVIFDISDRKSVEQKKDEFIGIASHELKTPVTSIKAYAEILLDQFKEAGDEQSALFLSKLNGQVDRLTGLIKDLLDATRISEGRMVYNEKPVDINRLLRDTADEIQRTDAQHTIELDLQELPIFTGDQERLQQVFVNLLSNAIKYSPDANKVLVKSYFDNSNISIAVQDFGIGISPETQSKLFERFFRSHDPSIATFPGLGLGLYISMQIVKQHGGSINVQSEKGKGSTFTVVLPVQH